MRYRPKIPEPKVERVDMDFREKRIAWERIKTDAPEVASFITRSAALFGAPRATEVSINGQQIVKSGWFDIHPKPPVVPNLPYRAPAENPLQAKRKSKARFVK